MRDVVAHDELASIAAEHAARLFLFHEIHRTMTLFTGKKLPSVRVKPEQAPTLAAANETSGLLADVGFVPRQSHQPLKRGNGLGVG